MTKPKQSDVKQSVEFRGMTRKEFASHRGVTRQRVDQWVADGTIQLLPDRRIDPNAADECLKQSTARKSHPEYMAALARKTEAQAQKYELDLAERRDELISREVAWDFFSYVATCSKNKFRGLPTKLAARLAVESKPAAVFKILLEEIDQTLRELQDMLDDRAGWPYYGGKK